MEIVVVRHRGRPRSTTWIGKLGAFALPAVTAEMLHPLAHGLRTFAFQKKASLLISMVAQFTRFLSRFGLAEPSNAAI
jgi:hypothetical protein